MSGWTHVFAAPPGDGSLTITDIRAACDRVLFCVSTSGDLRLLRDGATELRFLTLHTERLVEAARAEYGTTRELSAVDKAIRATLQDLYAIAPPAAVSIVEMRDALYRAIWHLRYGILVLAWARVTGHSTRAGGTAWRG